MARPRISLTKIWSVFGPIADLFEDGAAALQDGKVDEAEKARILEDFWKLVEVVRKK